MAFEFRLPDLGEGVTEGEVVTWHVREGEDVQEDQCMVEIMTDKATVTIGAPATGRVESLTAHCGELVAVGEVLVVINAVSTVQSPGTSSRSAASAVGDLKDSLPGLEALVRAASAGEGHSVEYDTSVVPHIKAKREAEGLGSDVQQPATTRATPATRRFAREQDVDLRLVSGTGDGGRVTRQDVLDFASRGPGGVGRATGAGRPQEVKVLGRAPWPVSRSNDGSDGRVPFGGIRRKIAERMVHAQHTAAHVTLVECCDASRLMEVRSRLKPHCISAGVQLTFLPFVVKAVVSALRRSPLLNSSLDLEREEIVTHGGYHIGIAAATDQGLVVPVLRDADRGGLLDVARELGRMGEGARAGTLAANELQGSTFTVSSLGKRAGLFATPILNTPNVGILSVHRIREQPVVRHGEIVIGHELMLALSLDHRIVDGREGAGFLYDVIESLEEPDVLLLS